MVVVLHGPAAFACVVLAMVAAPASAPAMMTAAACLFQFWFFLAPAFRALARVARGWPRRQPMLSVRRGREAFHARGEDITESEVGVRVAGVGLSWLWDDDRDLR